METTATVPDIVLAFVTRRLIALRNHERALSEIDSICGRYHASCALNERAASIARLERDLQEFRDLANARGVDPEEIIERLGGLPDVGRFGGAL